MKNTLLCLFQIYLFLLQNNSIAQTGSSTCSKYVIQTEDKITGEKTAEMKNFIKVSLGSKSLTFFLLRTPASRDVYLNISVIGASRCVNEDDKANILFTDGTRLEVLNLSFNCKANFSAFIYPNQEKDTPSYLTTKTIKTIRVWTSDSYVQLDIPIAKATILMESFRCLMDWNFN